MSLDMITEYHQFQCQICMQMITMDLNSSNDEKITKMVEHQNRMHLLEFTNTELTDIERIVYFTGNQIYKDGKPEPIFEQ